MHAVMAHFGYESKESSKIAIGLIRRGIDLNALNKQEQSPIHVAIKSFQNKSIKFALDFNVY